MTAHVDWVGNDWSRYPASCRRPIDIFWLGDGIRFNMWPLTVWIFWGSGE